ncbi:MAG TPA: YceI family protein [Longimicrobium sp.]|jgi:polyisoprenoid-binding protein YceI|nr:YceI family protein [Longimicrobium sp.]
MSIAESTTTTTWTIDPAHTTVEFSLKHLMISTVRGHFGVVSGTIVLDEENPAASSVTAEIDVTSIDTRQEQRDAHLRSADFFEVEKYPNITFKSTRIEALGGGRYNVYGDLTIRDVTREVVLETTDEGRGGDPWGGQRAGFSATTRIDRREFGLTWNQALETGGVLVGTDIKISLEVQAVKAA